MVLRSEGKGLGMSKGIITAIDLHFRNFKNFLLTRKNFNDFVKVKVHLIHRKQVPLLHNTVLILYYEGDGLVDVYIHI